MPKLATKTIKRSQIQTPIPSTQTPKAEPRVLRHDQHHDYPAAAFNETKVENPIAMPTSKSNVESFERRKDHLYQMWYNRINLVVFNRKLPSFQVGKTLLWCGRLSSSSASCRLDHENGIYTITLSKKIITNEKRLVESLARILCQVAGALLDSVDTVFGYTFWKYARLIESHFDSLSIKENQNYNIVYKYIFKCTECGHCHGRQRLGLNVETTGCQECNGKLDQIK